MPLEIERKFLVRHDGWRAAVVRSERLEDGLVVEQDGTKVRIRVSGQDASIAVKSKRIGRVRSEYEYAIPLADAQIMFATLCGHTLHKVRHFVPHGDHLWHVDVYEGLLAGVIIAEVEMRREDEEPCVPLWIGREVTDHPAFHKRAMTAAALKHTSPIPFATLLTAQAD